MRRFLSILLVVLLLFSLLAVPASAMSAGAVVASYGGVEAVSAIISGLGLTIDSLEKFDAWNTLVSSASEYLTAQNIIDAVGTIAALKSGSKIFFLPLLFSLYVTGFFLAIILKLLSLVFLMML